MFEAVFFGAAYTLTILGAFPAHSIQSATPTALNASGVAAGEGTFSDGTTHCLLFTGAKFVDLTPEAVNCVAGSINKGGSVAGTITYLHNSQQFQNGFIYQAGKTRIIAIALAFAALNDGGYALGTQFSRQPGLFRGGTWTELDDPHGCGMTLPTGLGNNNFAVGIASCDALMLSNPFRHIYYYFGFNYPVDLLPGAVNAREQVLLWDQSLQRQYHDGYVYEQSSGQLIDMGYLAGMESAFYTPVAENDSGEAVGSTDVGVMWTWTASGGISNLSALVPHTQYALTPVAIDSTGRVLCGGVNGAKTAWILLTPPT